MTDTQPNLKPPITTTAQALAYKAELEKIDPTVEYLMTLYLSPEITPDEIRKAKAAGVVGASNAVTLVDLLTINMIGVKSYPRGVTTNSDGGIESYETYYPVFEAMQEVGMVLNLHGEVPSDPNTVRPPPNTLRVYSMNELPEKQEYARPQCRAPVSSPSAPPSCSVPVTTYRT